MDHTQLSQTAAKNVHAVSGQRLAKAHSEIHETSLDTKQWNQKAWMFKLQLRLPASTTHSIPLYNLGWKPTGFTTECGDAL